MDQISAGSERSHWRSLVNMAVFSSLSSMVEPLPIKTFTGQETETVMHGDYSIIANFRTEISAIF
jgi:hypothetical protein